VLVDSSVWIDVLRGREHDRFRSFTSASEIVTCLPVLQEVLQGIGNDAAYRVARMALAKVRIVEPMMEQDLYDEAIELYRSARRRGLTVRSGVDCLIAVCAMRSGVTVLHKDRDFESLARVSALRTRQFDLSA
jgi:predicted nucleic acid-binding protein